MARYKISKAAVNDLYEIGLYTETEWGVEQRNFYLDELESHFNYLANHSNDLAEKSRDDIKQGCYFSSVRKHVVVFRRLSYGIRIVRVLHQRMDCGRHL
uniref:type II toxin-antitoxin system RelE/ParE family toxin n=1 Tax=Ningiella ruwaisensis TaxID=2364274 RepID=UPI00109F21EA|nr:type II toxin-antitoxin system RelE/ParE family toxin [Ningiella ruwaisensis]